MSEETPIFGKKEVLLSSKLNQAFESKAQKTHSHSKDQVGLDKVDNTADNEKKIDHSLAFNRNEPNAHDASAIGFKQSGVGAVESSVQTQLRKMPMASGYMDLAKAINAAVDGDFVLGVTSNLTVRIPSDAPDMQTAIDRLAPVSPKITIDILIESGHKITRGLLVEHGNYSQFMISAEDSVVYLDNDFTGPVDGVAEEYGSIPDNLIVGDRASMPVLNCLIDMENRFGHGYRLVAGSRGEARARCGVINAGHVGIKGDAATFYGPATRWDGASEAAIQATLASTFSMQRAVWSNSGTGIVCSRGSTVHAQSGKGVNCRQHAVHAKRGFCNVEDADLKGASRNAVLAELQGQVNATGADLRNSGEAALNIRNGGFISATDALTDNGSPSPIDSTVGAFNFVRGRGIIFDENSLFGTFPPQAVSWTPVIAGSTVAGEHTYTSRFARAVKSGGIVHLYGFIQIDEWDTSASGSILITGLPFTPLGPNNGYTQSGVMGRSNMDAPSDFCGWVITSAGNSPFLRVRANLTTGGVTDATVASFKNGTAITFSIQMEVKNDVFLL